MDRKSRKNFKILFIRLFFSLSVFLYLVGTETYLLTLTDFCYYHSQTETELVVSAKQEIDFTAQTWLKLPRRWTRGDNGPTLAEFCEMQLRDPAVRGSLTAHPA